MIDEAQSILERVFDCNVWKEYDLPNGLLVPQVDVRNDRCVEILFHQQVPVTNCVYQDELLSFSNNTTASLVDRWH
jgi:hypothetical protein